MIRQGLAVLSALVLASGSPIAAQGTAPGAAPLTTGAVRGGMLVSTGWLAEHLRDPDLVVLHVARRVQYDSGHIAGARHVTLADISLPAGPGRLALEMPPVDSLGAWAERMGIGDRTRVIVVPHDDTLPQAARVVLTLTYLGAGDRVSMLDGGFGSWKREGRAVTTDVPGAAARVSFTPRPKSALIATIDQVETITRDASASLVDARLPRFFAGDGGGFPRPGHIPTARNIPLNAVSTPDGRFRPVSELRALFTGAGVASGKPVVTYCHIGQQASLLWFVATYLGHDARMFDGSFQQWSGTERLPVVGPVAR